MRIRIRNTVSNDKLQLQYTFFDKSGGHPPAEKFLIKPLRTGNWYMAAFIEGASTKNLKH